MTAAEAKGITEIVVFELESIMERIKYAAQSGNDKLNVTHDNLNPSQQDSLARLGYKLRTVGANTYLYWT